MKFLLKDEQIVLFKDYVMPLVNESNARQFVSIKEDNENNEAVIEVEGKGLLEVMICADDAIIEYGMVNQDSLTPLGCKLQLLYDELLYQKNTNR